MGQFGNLCAAIAVFAVVVVQRFFLDFSDFHLALSLLSIDHKKYKQSGEAISYRRRGHCKQTKEAGDRIVVFVLTTLGDSYSWGFHKRIHGNGDSNDREAVARSHSYTDGGGRR